MMQKNIASLQQRIQRVAKAAGRSASSVRLLAVSKKHSAAHIQQAIDAGLREFGESYVQEALDKQQQLTRTDLIWHFIGPIQSNKTRPIALYFDWVHSIDRFKIAQRLNDHRGAQQAALNVCIQVNVSEEPSKAGVLFADLAQLAEQIQSLPRLRLRGLMAIPAREHDVGKQRQAFAPLRAALNKLNQQGFKMDTLSMGMTQDMDAAIMEGATIVRVGTALFGERS